MWENEVLQFHESDAPWVNVNTLAGNDGNLQWPPMGNSSVVLRQHQGAPPERVSPKQCLQFGGFTRDETRF